MNKRIKESTKNDISQAMKNGAISKIAKKRKENRIIDSYDNDTGECAIISTYQQKKADIDNLGLEYRLYKSHTKRKERIKERITRMMNTNRAYFLTLTFSDKMFARGCSPETRRRYISRFLKSECSEYLANIDFGSQNEREHYHAVVVPKTIIHFDKYRELFDSNINSKRIIKRDSSVKLVSRYISKLTNHALKENGFYKRIIYSRDIKVRTCGM